MTDSPKITHKIKAAAAFVTRSAGPGTLFYQGNPVPADATNLDALIEGDFVEPIGDDFSGHPSDLPPADNSTPTRAKRQTAAEKKAAAEEQAAADAKAAEDAAAAQAAEAGA